MAGAGQPWYMPLTWPIGHVVTALKIANPKEDNLECKQATSKLTSKPTTSKPTPTATSSLDLIGHLTSFAAATRSFLLAIFCIYFIHGGDDGFGYPAFGSAKEWSFEWMWPILLRNVLATFLIAGFWDWFLYFSPVAPSLAPYKINPIYPGLRQIKHDAFVTTIATICGSIIEIIICHLYASGKIEMQRTINENLWYTLAWAITITHWRIPHFWLVHRSMHPWKKSWIPKNLDPGRFLCRFNLFL